MSLCSNEVVRNTCNREEKVTGHRESTHEQTDVSAADHDGLAAVSSLRDPGALVLPRRPDPHHQDQHVEDNDGQQSVHMNGHLTLTYANHSDSFC